MPAGAGRPSNRTTPSIWRGLEVAGGWVRWARAGRTSRNERNRRVSRMRMAVSFMAGFHEQQKPKGNQGEHVLPSLKVYLRSCSELESQPESSIERVLEIQRG